MNPILIFITAFLLVNSTKLELLAAEPRVVKVFPLRVDAKNRTALSPSLFDRDAYQAVLRKDPTQCAGMIFKVQSKLPKGNGNLNYKARLELRGEKAVDQTSFTSEKTVKPSSLGSTWFQFDVTGDSWQKLKGINAWRISLWEGGKLISEQKSFLW